MRTLLFAALAALTIPSSSYAGDQRADPNVRLIIECSPKTAAAIEHLLQGLPAKVYRAEPTSTSHTGSASRPDTAKAMPTGVASVLPIWNAIEKAVAAQPSPITIQKMSLSPRGARFQVIAKDHQALVDLRKSLERMPEVTRRARNADEPVAPEPVVKVGELVKGGFLMPFREVLSTDEARVKRPLLITPAVLAARQSAGVVLFRQGRENRDEHRDHVRISSESVFREATLASLRAYVVAVTEAKGVVPTEVRWQLRDAKNQDKDNSLIGKSTVKIAQWMSR